MVICYLTFLTESGKLLSVDDLDINLVATFLKGVGSKLLEEYDKGPVYLFERMKILRNVGDKRVGDVLQPVWVPRNVSLLFFHPTPHEFFGGARAEIALYTHDDVTDEKLITGPIDQQIDQVLSFILNTTKEEARHEFVAYPARALREAVVNAFYHRSYEHCHCDPVKIHIKPNCIDVISYPGPNPALKKEHFTEGNEVPCVPSRNRRIAEFLKDRKLAEGRFTGVRTIFKTMKQNKNPKPSFSFSSEHFQVRLPGHPKYIAYSILRDVDNLCAKGEKEDAVKLLKEFLDKHLFDEHSFICSDMLIRKLLELHDDDASHPNVQPYDRFISEKLQRRIPLIKELCKWSVAEKMQDTSKGVTIVKKLVEEGATCEDLQSAIMKAVALCQERSDDAQQLLEAVQSAHKLFEAMGDVTQTNAYVAFQFACCKFNLYVKKCRSDKQRKDLIRYLKEAEDYVNKATQLTNEEYKNHLATQYRQLGYIHSQLCLIQKSTDEQIITYYNKARRYNPEIRISPVFIPPEYRSQYMSSANLGSPARDFSFVW